MEAHAQKLARVLAEVVQIVPYDPAWPQRFREEKDHLERLFPYPLIRRVEHFGSTAIPGLSAKPIIDMLIEVPDLNETRRVIPTVLEAEGYDYFWRPTSGSNTPPFYAWFIRRDSRTGARTHHLHMVEPHFVQHWDRLLFRDYLISHPALAEEYERLKRRLATLHTQDRVLYTREKAAFIDSVTEAARKGLPNGV